MFCNCGLRRRISSLDRGINQIGNSIDSLDWGYLTIVFSHCGPIISVSSFKRDSQIRARWLNSRDIFRWIFCWLWRGVRIEVVVRNIRLFCTVSVTCKFSVEIMGYKRVIPAETIDEIHHVNSLGLTEFLGVGSIAVTTLSPDTTVLKADFPAEHRYPIREILSELHFGKIRPIPNRWERRIIVIGVKSLFGDFWQYLAEAAQPVEYLRLRQSKLTSNDSYYSCPIVNQGRTMTGRWRTTRCSRSVCWVPDTSDPAPDNTDLLTDCFGNPEFGLWLLKVCLWDFI